MSITFIQDPPYVVNFEEFKEKPRLVNENSHSKIGQIAQHSLQLVGLFFNSLAKASWLTLKNMGVSFKYIVLGYYGPNKFFEPPADIYLAVFKVFIWVLGMAWCTLATTYRLISEKLNSNQNDYLRAFADAELNLDHIKTQEITFDMSGVPETVQVNNLADIFDNINFSDPEAPGYMSRTSLQEGNEDSLNKLINRINTREAFLGTPPAYDTPRLMAFYQHMEDAIRLSIHKMNEKLAAFKEVNGENPATYDQNTLSEYNGLLEDQARIAIDLAIAGKHCGARYMGEAMSVYYYIQGENLNSDKCLEDYLVEILAQKRKEIALGQIQRYLGSDTHQFGKYMSKLGKILAIPGTQNVIEQLSTNLDVDLYLRRFFEEYTVDNIILKIQEEVKKSRVFQEKIIDWLRLQVKDWDNQEPIDLLQKAEQAQNIIEAQENVECEQVQNIRLLIELINVLKHSGIPLPYNQENDSNAEWDDFIEKLFRMEQVENFLNENYPSLGSFDLIGIQENCKTNSLYPGLLTELKANTLADSVFDAEKLKQYWALVNKAKEIQKEILFPLGLTFISIDSIYRVIKGETDFRELIQNTLELDRGNEFLENLNIFVFGVKDSNPVIEGLSKEMMEWLLVSHKILLPQTEE